MWAGPQGLGTVWAELRVLWAGPQDPRVGAWEEPRLLWAGPGLLLTLPPSSLLQKLGRRFKSQAAGGSVPLVWSQQLEKPQPSKKKGEKEA